ncbi:MAG TPA: DUF4397 domain-containing protein [Terracidiphilus sp.]|jgi:hypothetical protein|nr:DUF4397 domain-containing protein [Terracidiphilus sp.]
MKSNGNVKHALTGPRLVMIAGASLPVALGISGCQVVAGFSQPSLVRIIDASYIAPAVNIYVEKNIFAGNIGEGYISNYGTAAPNTAAQVQVTAATGGATLVSAAVTLKAGAQHTVFLTDNGSTPTLYNVTVLEDAQTPAASGHSEFRFLNQAPRTGALDVYMIPAGTTMANTIPICTNIAVGQTCGYISFASQTVTMVITPTGLTTPKYTSTPLALTGGEVRTVVMVDSQLTSDPPVSVVIANDLD